jgi:hypothetical protein
VPCYHHWQVRRMRWLQHYLKRFALTLLVVSKVMIPDFVAERCTAEPVGMGAFTTVDCIEIHPSFLSSCPWMEDFFEKRANAESFLTAANDESFLTAVEEPLEALLSFQGIFDAENAVLYVNSLSMDRLNETASDDDIAFLISQLTGEEQMTLLDLPTGGGWTHEHGAFLRDSYTLKN